MTLEAKIEALLFHKAEKVTVNQLAKWLECSPAEIELGLERLSGQLTERGIRLIRLDQELMLGSAEEAGSLIEQLTKEELSCELSRAALETLTLIAYEGPLSRAEIDYIRGVNSSFTLRHLLIRGLIKRELDKQDNRRFIYRPTLELLRYLGIEKIEDLPDYLENKKHLTEFLANRDDSGADNEIDKKQDEIQIRK